MSQNYQITGSKQPLFKCLYATLSKRLKNTMGEKEILRREEEVINWQINHWKNTSEISLSGKAATERFFSI